MEIRYVDSRFQAIWVTVTNRDAILRAKWFHENDTFELKNMISAFENDSNRRPCNTLIMGPMILLLSRTKLGMKLNKQEYSSGSSTLFNGKLSLDPRYY